MQLTENQTITISKSLHYEILEMFGSLNKIGYSNEHISQINKIIEALELAEDLEDIKEYEKEKANGTLVTYSVQEIEERLGI